MSKFLDHLINDWLCHTQVTKSYRPQSAAALPRNLKRLREAKGWSPTQLASKAKVSASTVRGMEAPEYYDKSEKWNSPNPTLVSLLAVAVALGVGIEELVEEREK